MALRKPAKNNKIKEDIYTTSKKAFYERGFLDVTLKEVAEQLGIPASLITYYFKTRDNLVSCIFDDFLKSIRNRIESYANLNISSILFQQILTSYIYYDIVLSDENNTRFFKEILLRKNDSYQYYSPASDESCKAIAHEFGLTITQVEYEIFAQMQSSAKTAFFRHYFTNDMGLDILQIVMFLEGSSARQIGIDGKVVNDYLMRTHAVIRDIDYSDLKFLV
ncbi:MAG: TetR/AcrR family transcriptional regulator [Eubacteriaceae bacterium]|nr:TetR/AcrR family transcriptional regulator [Eubacteriaceae bacterium]